MSNNNMLHGAALKSQDEVTEQLEDATALLAQEEEIVTPDALETERMLAKVMACSCIPLISAFNATVKQKGRMGFNISRPADGRPVKVGGVGNPWG